MNDSDDGAVETLTKLREQLLYDGMDDWVSLSLVDSRVHQHFPTATLAERQAITLETIREMVSQGLFDVGYRRREDDRFAAFDEPLDQSMERIRDAYVANYDDALRWVYRFWFDLTDVGQQVVTSTERGRKYAREVAEASKRALQAWRLDNDGEEH